MDLEDGAAIDVELEALQAVYDSAIRAEFLGAPSNTHRVHLEAAPYTAADQPGTQLVSARVVMECLPGYPDLKPHIRVLDPVGLGEVRKLQLRAHLEEIATAMEGELMLTALCDSALQWLTDNNWPEGDCSFCLDVLLDASASTEKLDLVQLPCHHCFHWNCFADWWAWQQAEFSESEERIVCEYGGDTHMARLQVQQRLPPKAEGIFAIPCPTCRTQAAPSALAPWLPRLKDRARASAPRLGPTPSQDISAVLPPDLINQVQQMQIEFSQLLQKQAANDGLIDESKRLTVPASTSTTVPEGESCPPQAPNPGMSSRGGGRRHKRRGQRRRPPTAESCQGHVVVAAEAGNPRDTACTTPAGAHSFQQQREERQGTPAGEAGWNTQQGRGRGRGRGSRGRGREGTSRPPIRRDKQCVEHTQQTS